MTQKTHRIDDNIVKITEGPLDKWDIWLNGQSIMSGYGGIENGMDAFHDMVEALKSADYEVD